MSRNAQTTSSEYQVVFTENNRGTIHTPFFHNAYLREEPLEVSFSELYKGMFSFGKWAVVQFLIKSDDVNEAIEMAKDRLELILANGYPDRLKDILVVTGFRYGEKNEKTPYTLSFMENTHHQNQFTASSYKMKEGDLLRHCSDGDGWGFWYAVDKNGNRISSRLKGDIFLSALSDGEIKALTQN